MPTNEKLTDILFPLGGVNKLQEFQEQPPGTTPDAQNVRGTNPRSLRVRGGSRAGLAKYITMQVPSGDGVIQHLNVIVDPQAPYLPQNFTVPGDDWVEDPLNPGHFVPPGGWGNQPNPNAATPDDPTAEVSLEQSVVDGYEDAAVETTTVFLASVGTNTLVLAVIATKSLTANATVTVKNAALDNFTQIGAYKRFTKLGSEFSVSAWYRRADAGPSDRSLKVTPSVSSTLVVAGMEWLGVNASVVGNTNSNSGNAATMTAGNVAASDDDEAVVGIFLAGLSPDTVTPGAGYTLEIDHNDGTLDNTDIQLYVTYRLNLDLPNSSNPSATFAGGADDFAAIALTLKD